MAWWRSPLKNRITRYRHYNLPIDSPGFYVYLREADGPTWSPSWRPVEHPLDAWRAEHEPGLTRFVACRGEVEAVLELFIAPETHALVWDLTITNHGAAAVALDVFGYAELCLLDWKQDTDWACYVKHNLQVTRDATTGALIYLYRHFHFNPHLADCPLVYFASSRETASFCGDRDAFVGAYRTERNPLAVERNACEDISMFCGDPCAALQCPVTIAPESTDRMQFFLGCEPGAIVEWPRALESARESIRRLCKPGEAERLKLALHDWWDEYLGIFQAELPDADIERQINIWGPVQTVHTGRYSRSISQHAAGVRTLGFRDTCQDMMAVATRRPEWAADTLLYLISQQYQDGHAPHQCNPIEKAPAEPRVHIDNALWLPMLAHAILCETGDVSLLDESVAWLATDNLTPVGSDTVWTHLLRVSDFIEAHLGIHRLPRIYHGDWNDSIGKFSRKGSGESVFAAQQYVYVLELLCKMASLRADDGARAVLETRREQQSAAILAHAWDGGWWRRAFDDEGNPVGSVASEFGKIWLNSQSWAVLSGVGTAEQKLCGMDAVAKWLDTDFCGLKKLHPSYHSFPDVLEPFTGYSPGCGENGAIFCHANTWAIIAEALLGRPDMAWHYYRQLVPHLALQKVGIDRYQAEPYAFVSNIIGPENPKYGWANVTQVTGTAAWMDIAATQYLLGIRPELKGLRIDPRLPADWPGFTTVRQFRGCRVEIEVRRTTEGEVSRLTLDGRHLPDFVVPAKALVGKSVVSVVRVVGSAVPRS